MTKYHLILILILIIAPFLVLLIYSRVEQKKDREKKIAAALAKKEQEQLKIKKKKKAGVTVTVKKEDTNFYNLVLLNSGGVVLKNVELDLILEEDEINPLSSSEHDKKFPVSILKVGHSVTLSSIDYQQGRTYNVLVKWTESNGVRVKDQLYVTVH